VTKEASLFSAVAVRHRWWTYLDAPEVELIRLNNNRFSVNAVMRISKAYGVRRGLKLLDENAKEKLARLLSDELQDFPGGLQERASRLAEVAAKMADYTHGTQISAVSKFAWFLWPDSWTMYDSRARAALKARDHRHFYRKLDELEFSGTVSRLDEMLERYGLSALSAGRIVDTFLLLRSSEDQTSDNELASAYLDTLTEEPKGRLRAAARELAKNFRNDQIVRESL
jgi:hypothetical protein